MAPKTGTYDIASLQVNNQTIDQLDFDRVNDAIQDDLAAHNTIVDDMVGQIAEPTTERQLTSGTGDSGEMIKADEYTRGPTQRVAGLQTLGIPLDMFQYALGWTRQWFRQHTVGEMVRTSLAAQKAHRKKIVAELKRAIFLSANYTFKDYLVAPNIDLGVKRFANGDSFAIPEGPNGEVYDAATHSHYLANATLTAAAVTNLINTVVEHGHGGQVRLVIAAADEAAFRALTGFVGYVDPRLTLGTSSNQAGERLDITRMDNRAIGIFGQAEVWVKPWGIANYAFAYDAEDDRRPVAYRTRSGSSALGIVAEIALYPLHAEYMEAEFGFAVRTRTNGAVLYFAGGSYTDPTING